MINTATIAMEIHAPGIVPSLKRKYVKNSNTFADILVIPPARTAVGTDFNRVNLLMAVLEKKVGLRLAASDAYVNIAGGMKMTEPAIDLGICLAIVSSAKDIVIPDNVMVFGEVGLSGEIRAVSMAGQRVQEAKKLGFGTVVLPEVCKSSVGKVEGINLVYVSQIRDAIGYIMKK